MLTVNTSTVDRKLEQWSTSVVLPITNQSQVKQPTNQQSSNLSPTEQQSVADEMNFIKNSGVLVERVNKTDPVQSFKPLPTLLNCRAQSLALVAGRDCHQIEPALIPTDQANSLTNLLYLPIPNSNDATSQLPIGSFGWAENQPPSTIGSSLTNIPVLPPSPYEITDGRIACSSAASDTNSTCGSRRHFRRRVAHYHQNHRHSSQHHSQQRSTHPPNAGFKTRPTPNVQNGVVGSWKNSTNRTTVSLSPPVRCSSGTSDPSPLDNTNLSDMTERRAKSVGPPSSTQKDLKSGGSSDPLQSPSGGESLDLLSVDCMVSAWAHTDSGQPNRTLSSPMMHSSQTGTTQNALVPGVFTQSTPDKTCAMRSRSHHQLRLRDSGEPREQTESRIVSTAPNMGFCTGYLSNCGDGRFSCSNTFCSTCHWQSPKTNDLAFTVLDRWYQRYYTISRHPDNCITKILRSPISVLAPCKGKRHLKIESNNGVIQLLIIEAKGLRSCTDAPCNSFVKVTVVPDRNNIFTQTTQIVESKANPVYNKSISLDLNKSKHARRILLTVYCQQTLNGENELIGGMSFGVTGITTKKAIAGWYYLLNETMARKKHLRAGSETNLGSVENHNVNSNSTECAPPTVQFSDSSPGELVRQEMIQSPRPGSIPTGGFMTTECGPGMCGTPNPMTGHDGTRRLNPVMIPRAQHFLPTSAVHFRNPTLCPPVSPGSPQVAITVPKTNQALNNMHLFRFLLTRGPKGFGFTLSGGCPVYVSHVEPNSPAMQAGVQPGDFIVAVDNSNVSRSTTDSVVRIFRIAQNPVHLTICRPTTVCVKTHSSPKTYGSKTFSNLFQRGCLSQMKKSASNDSMRPDCAAAFCQTVGGTTVIPQTPVYPGPSFVPYNNPIQAIRSNGPPAYPTLTFLPNSRSLYQVSPNLQAARTGASAFPSSRTEMRLCDVANGHMPPTQIPTTPSSIPVAKPRVICLPSTCGMNSYVRTEGGQVTIDVDSISSMKQVPPSPTIPTISRPANVCSLLSSPSRETAQTLPAQCRLSPREPPTLSTDPPIVDCLKYVGHVKQVDFRQHSPRLEHYGCLNLLESNCCSKVELLLFSDLLLIAQRAPNHFFTVIKDPIYNTKICYVNIPSNASDQLILQYIDDHNRKQIVHFQGSNVREWLAWIQGHMVYNSNWWMENIQCPVNF